MSRITWLHISDFHFREGKSWDQDIVLQSLVVDIKKLCTEASIDIDFIVVSGDIAFSGKDSEYNLTRDFFDQLKSVTGVLKDRILTVPGNHDIDRTEINKFTQLQLPNRELCNEFLSDSKSREFHFKRLLGYNRFLSDYFHDNRIFGPNNYYDIRYLTLGDLTVAFLCLNSAWASSSDMDRNNLLIGERQVREALTELEESDFRIALFHHPLEWLTDYDRRDITPLLRKHTDICLHGHLHEPMFEISHSPGGSLTTIGAGCCFLSREHQNSYNITSLDFNSGTGKTWLRAYTDRDGGHWFADNISYEEVDGEFVWQMPKHFGTRAEEIRKSFKAIGKLNRVFISHGVEDRDFSRKLAINLKNKGIEVWIDDWELQVGDSLLNKIREGIRSAGWFIVVLSPASVKSHWVNMELNAAIIKELAQKRVFIVPVLHQDCELPIFFKDKLYADFREDFEIGFSQLMRRLKKDD